MNKVEFSRIDFAGAISFARQLRKRGVAIDNFGVRYAIIMEGGHLMLRVEDSQGRRGYIGYLAGRWQDAMLADEDIAFLRKIAPKPITSIRRARRFALELVAHMPELAGSVAAHLETI